MTNSLLTCFSVRLFFLPILQAKMSAQPHAVMCAANQRIHKKTCMLEKAHCTTFPLPALLTK